MVKDMIPLEERRGTSALFVWSSVVVVAAGIGFAILLFCAGLRNTEFAK
jgi:hypothetical protein